MKPPVQLRFVLFLLALAIPCAGQQEELIWHQSLPDAITQAEANHKPILLAFRCAP